MEWKHSIEPAWPENENKRKMAKEVGGLFDAKYSHCAVPRRQIVGHYDTRKRHSCQPQCKQEAERLVEPFFGRVVFQRGVARVEEPENCENPDRILRFCSLTSMELFNNHVNSCGVLAIKKS